MIRKIQIEGLKALRKTESLSLGRITLLTGINGRGKSTLLQALLLLSQSLRHSNGSPLVLYPDGDWCSLGSFKDLINVDSNDNKIVIRYSTDATSENQIELTFYQHKENPYLGELKSLKVDGLETRSEQYESGAATPYSVETNTEEVGVTRVVYSDLNELQKLQHIYFIASNRSAAQGEGKLNLLQDSKFIGAQGQNVLNVLSQCTDNQLKELESAMSNILDGAHITTQKDNNTNSVYLFLDSDDNGNNFKPVNVGYGYSYIISLLLSLVLASGDEIVIIENPEAHLHPQAQARLMEYMVRIAVEKNIQCFIESHSDHIVNGLLLALKERKISENDASIMFFERKDKDGKHYVDVSNLELTASGRVRRPPKGFCDQYGIDLRKLI